MGILSLSLIGFWRWVFPLFDVRRANALLDAQEEKFDLDVAVNEWRDRFTADPTKTDAAKDVYDTEIERLRRLEDKLTTQLSFLTPLVILITGLVSFAVPRADVDLSALSILALAELASAYYFASRGHAARKIHLVSNLELSIPLGPDVRFDVDLASRRMAYVQRNQLEGLRLNNWISGAQSCLLRFMVLLAVAGAIVFAEQTWG